MYSLFTLNNQKRLNTVNFSNDIPVCHCKCILLQVFAKYLTQKGFSPRMICFFTQID